MKKILLVAFGISLGITVLGISPTPAAADCNSGCVSTNTTCMATAGTDTNSQTLCTAALATCTATCTATCITNCTSALTTCQTAAASDPAKLGDCATKFGSCSTACTATTTTAPVTSKQSTIDAATKKAAASYWFSLVPAACQGPTGCDICQITLIFTNAANIIGAILSALSLLMFILGGMLLIFSAGVESRIELGRKILIGTVSGLAIVFLAWFVVNLIVRLASSSATTPNGLPDSSKSKIFSADWWNPPSCEPKLPTACFGLTVGALCGGSSATDCSSSNPVACSCFRKLDTTNGDDISCGGTADTDIATASSTTLNKTKQCFCASGCRQYAVLSGQAYACTNTTTVSSGSYTTNDQLACPGSTDVCAKAN